MTALQGSLHPVKDWTGCRLIQFCNVKRQISVKVPGVIVHLSESADSVISDHDFMSHERLLNGCVLNPKDELMFCQIFKEHCGELEHYVWKGQTKEVRVQKY